MYYFLKFAIMKNTTAHSIIYYSKLKRSLEHCSNFEIILIVFVVLTCCSILWCLKQ